MLDEASVLACAAYVDLNPIRAALAETPEASGFTGAKDRIDDLTDRDGRRVVKPRTPERSRQAKRSGWLSPVESDKSIDPTGPDIGHSGRRASDKGFLPMPLTTYLELLDWTGRQLRAGKRGKIPAHLSPILERLGLDVVGWCDVVKQFGRTFKRVAGTTDHLAEEAKRRGQRWVQAPGNLLTVSG